MSKTLKESISKPVFNLLLQSVRIDDKEDALQTAEKIISCNDICWNDLFYLAELHSIKPQLANLINRVDSSLIPEEFREKVNLAYRGSLYLQMSYVAEYLRIRQVLIDSGIITVPFKGFWLASEFYGNLADRESVDIDLFVKEDDLEGIAIIMFEEGYKPQSDFLPYTLIEIKRKFHEYNFDRYEDDKRLFHIEFHWRMSTEFYGMDIKLEDLSSEIRNGKLQDHEIDVFSPSANFLLAVMHHGGRDLFRELKQVLDISMILKKCPGLNWMMILNEADRFNIRNLVLIAVKLASDLTGVGTPSELSEIISTDKINKLAESRKKLMAGMSDRRSGLMYGLNRWLFRMQALTSLRIKLKITWLIIVVLIVTFLIPPGLRKYFPYGEFAS